jgi:hypothetical protein
MTDDGLYYLARDLQQSVMRNEEALTAMTNDRDFWRQMACDLAESIKRSLATGTYSSETTALHAYEEATREDNK